MTAEDVLVVEPLKPTEETREFLTCAQMPATSSARHSFSIWAYHCSTDDKVLEQCSTGLSYHCGPGATHHQAHNY